MRGVIPEFYFSVTCEKCDDDILYGPCASLVFHEGLPVIPYDMAGQTVFNCGCGATFYTGDFELYGEGEV